MTQVVAYLEAIVGADITSFRRGMQNVRRETGVLTDDFTGMAGNLAKVGQAMTYSLTTPLLAVGSQAVKTASDFDASMHNINSIAHMTQGEFDTLTKKVLDFGTTTRSGPQAVADSLYEIYSAGLTGSKAFDLMQQSVKTAEAGLADLEKTTNALTATVMAYSNQNLTASEASNVWTKMVQVGVGSLDDFLANAQKVLPLASNLGISFQDLGANAAYLSQQGGGAKKAMTALAMAFSNILKPNDTMIQAFQKLGVATGQDLIKKFGSFEGAVVALHKAVKDPIEFNKMFSKTGLEAVLSMTNNVDALNKSIADFGVGLQDATQSAWEEQMKSYAASSDKFNSAIQGLMIALGTQLFPLLTGILTPLTNFITKLAQSNPEVLKLAVAFGVAVAAAGPLIWIISSLFSPIGIIIGLIAALGTAFATNFGGIRDIVTSVISEAMRVMEPFITMVKALWEVLSGTGVDIKTGEGVNGFITTLNDKINELLGGTLPTAVAGKEIKIPIKAGMTLSDIYYNSEWSKDLQSKFSYDEFIKQATGQIKGGDPRWLQVGSTLTFTIGVTPQVGPPDERQSSTFTANMGPVYNTMFLKVKDEIQKQYDFIFKDKPLVNDQGQDISGSLPVLQAVKNAVDNVKIVVDTWKDAFGVTLQNIKNGIGDFLKGFEGHDYSGLQKLIGTLITIFSDIWTVVQIIGSKILIYASDIAGSVLKEAGTVIADFLQIISDIGNGKSLEAIGQDINKFIVQLVEGIANIVAHILGGDGSKIGPGLTEFANAVSNALLLVQYAFQYGWRDIKIAINQFVDGLFSSLADAMSQLHYAHIISDEQFLKFNISARNIKVDTKGAEFAKAIEDAIKAGGFTSNINIGTDNLRTVVQMGGSKAIADNLTVVGKNNLMDAIKLALTNNNANGDLDVLLPIALSANMDLSKLDFSKLAPDIRAKLAEALKNTNVDTGTQDTTIGWLDTGKNLIAGIISGIDGSKADANKSVTDAANGMKDAMNNEFGIHSPSTWAINVAAMIVAGLIGGFVVGTVLLVVASNLMTLIGVKTPIANSLTPAWARGIGQGVSNNLAGGLTDGIGGILIAVAGIIAAFAGLELGIIGIGNDLASKMQTIVDKVTGQLNALKNAIKDAANLQVPSANTSGTGGKPPDERANGGTAQGWTWVGERGPELVNFEQKGTVIPNHAIRDAMTNNNYNSENSGGNTIIINGVQDVDGLLFELKRRGIKLV